MLLIEIIILLLTTYLFSGYVLLQNSDVIINKFYTFFYVVLLNFLMEIIGTAINKEKIIIPDIVDKSVKLGLVSVIAYDTFNDLDYRKTFENMGYSQKTIILTIMIVAFVSIIQIFQVLIAY